MAAPLAWALPLALGGALAMAAAVAEESEPGAASRPVPGPGWAVMDRRGVLWTVVRQCVANAPARGAQGGGPPDGTDEVSRPNACARVDPQAGYVVLKDHSPAKPYAFLLLPTDRVTGIEDSRLWVTGGTNYWRAAYANWRYVEKVLKRPLRRTQVGFAANSIYGRTQDQLHIHISCIRPDVAATLADHIGTLSDRHWTWLPPMAGKSYRYRALLTDDAALARTDPVRLLAGDVYPRGSMLPHTLFMAPVTLPDGRQGFAFLDSEADQDVRQGHGTAAGNHGASEELLDDSCAIGRGGVAARSGR
ncbi:CDP-diacylglycerol diphosphatase [Bordetella sp. H567]|uniref:CDP-diacylglycerol diphosphatase n=1 Tax=Bordetella sp. H567 TaxID=1697043 RepID=UPI000835C47D|nr:CDP-diacylglycerol diphosphatase [Bordetella sp. H567]